MLTKHIISALLIGSLCQFANALPKDKEQPINVNADSAQKEQETGLTTLIGTVEIQQGSILIKANKAIIHYNGNTINKIICLGNPAHFQQQMNPTDGLVIGRANEIEYHQATDELKMRGDASVVKADGSKLESKTINYSLTSESMNAGGRVHLTIPPTKSKGE